MGTIEVSPVGRTQAEKRYVLVVDADLRDRGFYNTFYLFQKWICRLAKRVYIERVLVEMQSLSKEVLIRNTDDCYSKMFEFEDGWYEYLLWDKTDKNANDLDGGII